MSDRKWSPEFFRWGRLRWWVLQSPVMKVTDVSYLSGSGLPDRSLTFLSERYTWTELNLNLVRREAPRMTKMFKRKSCEEQWQEPGLFCSVKDKFRRGRRAVFEQLRGCQMAEALSLEWPEDRARTNRPKLHADTFQLDTSEKASRQILAPGAGGAASAVREQPVTAGLAAHVVWGRAARLRRPSRAVLRVRPADFRFAPNSEILWFQLPCSSRETLEMSYLKVLYEL